MPLPVIRWEGQVSRMSRESEDLPDGFSLLVPWWVLYRVLLFRMKFGILAFLSFFREAFIPEVPMFLPIALNVDNRTSA